MKFTPENPLPEIKNPQSYPILYWLDKTHGDFHYLGWQTYVSRNGKLERIGEASKIGPISRCGPVSPKLKSAITQRMREDAALHAKAME